MILNSVQNGLLVWPTIVQEDGTNRTKKYKELSVIEKLQADCLDVPVFTQGDDPIACLNKAMTFLSVVAASRFPSTNNQLRTSSNSRNQATIQDDKEGRKGWLNVIIVKVKDTWLGYALSLRGQGTLHGLRTRQCWLKHRNLTEDLDAYDSDCDDVSTAQAVLMDNLSNYGFDVISKVPHSEPYHHDIDNQSVHAMQYFEQTPVVDFTDNEITSDSKTLILEEISRSKMLAKQNDPISKGKKYNTTPINYVELNRLSEDFGKRFVPQQELSAEQTF
ncbi:hypothetical protein Tco_1532943 [Tanacetum coccineum]